MKNKSIIHRLQSAYEAFNGRRFTPNDAAVLAKQMFTSMRASSPKNSYDTNDKSIRTSQPLTDTDPYTLQVGQLPKTRALSRCLARNAGEYKAGITTTVDSVVGTGLRPTPQVKTSDGELETTVNKQLSKLWETYQKPENWDSRGKLSFVGEGQRLALRIRLIDGSYFLRAMPNAKSSLGVVWDPFKIDHLDTKYDTFYDLNNSGKQASATINGIRLDRYGAPAGYYLKQFDGQVISSNQIIHTWEIIDPSYVIGEPVGTAVLNQIWDRKELVEDYRLKMDAIARTLYNIAESSGYPNPVDADSGGIIPIDKVMGNRVKEAPEVPKMPDNVNETLVPLMSQMEVENAAAIGISRTSVMKDLRGTTFAGATFANVLDWTHYKPLRKDFIDDFCNPFYEKFVFNAIMSGRVNGVDRMAFLRRPEHYTAVTWSGDERLSVDKKKDADAGKVLKETGDKILSDRLEDIGTTLPEHIIKTKREYDAIMAEESESPGMATMLGYPYLSTKENTNEQ